MCRNCDYRAEMFQFMTDLEKKEYLRNHRADEWIAMEKMDNYEDRGDRYAEPQLQTVDTTIENESEE